MIFYRPIGTKSWVLPDNDFLLWGYESFGKEAMSYDDFLLNLEADNLIESKEMTVMELILNGQEYRAIWLMEKYSGLNFRVCEKEVFRISKRVHGFN